MKTWLIATLCLGFILTSNSAQAQIVLPTYDQLCGYEPACKKAAKISKGELIIKRPNENLMGYYERIRPLIIKVAGQYGVDAVTLVLTPLAENTMNVKIDDKIADAMVMMQVTPDAEIGDKQLSVGPGQIYAYAAKNVEALSASIDKRPLRDKRAIVKALETPEGALRYAAAILRDAQNVYAAGGRDISRRPEILATLYNIGKVKLRLQNSKGREPYPNYFGWFAGQNYRLVKERLKLPSVLKDFEIPPTL